MDTALAQPPRGDKGVISVKGVSGNRDPIAAIGLGAPAAVRRSPI
jgi:hypothetical protein